MSRTTTSASLLLLLVPSCECCENHSFTHDKKLCAANPCPQRVPLPNKVCRCNPMVYYHQFKTLKPTGGVLSARPRMCSSISCRRALRMKKTYLRLMQTCPRACTATDGPKELFLPAMRSAVHAAALLASHAIRRVPRIPVLADARPWHPPLLQWSNGA